MARSGQWRLPTQLPRYDSNLEQRRNAEIERHFRDHFSQFEIEIIVDAIVEWVANTFVFSASASLYDSSIIFSSLGATWTPITNYESNGVLDKNITTNLVNGTMIFDYGGIYEVSVAINLSHNESNQGRETELRFFNVTDGVQAGESITIAIGRNQPGLNFFVAFPTEITEAQKGKEFRLEMGNGDSITAITGSIEFYAKAIGHWQEPLLDPLRDLGEPTT